MASAKITVAGAGIFGLACAWELARRGQPVRVYEAAKIGAGSSGGHVGALAPHAPENWNAKKQIQLEALSAAQGWWAEVARVGGQDPGYARSGRIQPIAPDALARMQDRIDSAHAHWPDWAGMALTQAPQAALVPVSASGWWLVDGLTARLNPRRALSALAAAIRARGGEIIEHTSAPDDAASIRGPSIWSTGVAGLRAFGGGGVKGQSALMALDLADQPQVFADGVHIVPHADGTVAIGSTSERDATDTQTDAQLDTLIARACAICPALAEAQVIDRWAGIRPRAASRAPLVGPWPERPGHYIANGGFKIGLAMAPAAAGMLADLILDGRDRIPDSFRPPNGLGNTR